MFIVGLGTASPARRYTQKECWDTAKVSPQILALSARSQAILRKVLLGNNGIEARWLVFESLSEALAIDPDTMQRRFTKHAPELAAAAGLRALTSSGVQAADLDGLIISTCTGYLCPGLTSFVSERLGLKPDALLLDLVGQGCGASVPNLRTAEALLHSGQARRVLSICVEVCSAAFFLDEDPGVLISACLFGDGAAAAILSVDPLPGRRQVEWLTAGTLLSPADRDYLRFEQCHGLLRNRLAKQVPELAGKYAQSVLADVLGRTGLRREQIAAWILHAGGKDVLNSLKARLALDEADLQWSAGVLREQGNLSSASALFVLESALTQGAPAGYWWLSTFGAGFSCHGALLQVRDD